MASDGVEVEDGDGAGEDHGQVEDHSVISHHGKDLDGYSVEEHAGGYLACHGDLDGGIHGHTTITHIQCHGHTIRGGDLHTIHITIHTYGGDIKCTGGTGTIQHTPIFHPI